ncbi:MAG: site-2 protease family protein [Betaproteobacteria bacterium]|nr:site-2 protease family protein [Betaproteobacteria bacterium]
MSSTNMRIEDAILTYCGFLVAITMREAAYAVTARQLGDRSSETESRATVNPIPHVDLLGTIILPAVFLFSGVPFLLGWAKQLTIDTRYFKKIRRDINIAELAGPLTNFGLALLCGVLAVSLGYRVETMMFGEDPIPRLLLAIAKSNIVIGLLNLLPFPGSSGWRLLLNNIRYQWGQSLIQHANIISIVMIVLLLTNILSPLFMGALGLYMFVLQSIA